MNKKLVFVLLATMVALIPMGQAQAQGCSLPTLGQIQPQNFAQTSV